MARTLTINITDISVRPYGYTSPLAEDPQAFDLFDTRSDFARMEGMTHLAVAFRTENLRSKYSWSLINRRKSHHTFWVNVVYPGSRIPVTSRTVYVEMDPEEEDGIERVDIPLRMSQICENQFYEVEIVAPGINDDAPLISKRFRIVNLKGLAPSKYYTALEASLHTRQISTCFFSDYDSDSYCAYPLGNAPWCDGGKQLFITFKLMMNYCAPYHEPEIMVRLYRFDEEYTEIRANVYDAEAFNYQYISGDEMYIQVPVTDRMGKDDYIYAEVQALGCPVAGAVFDTEVNRDPRKGRLMGDDIKFIPCFDSIKALDFIIRRRNLIEEAEKAEEMLKNNDAPSITESLDHLTGLERVKSKVTSYRQLMEFNRRRRDAGLPSFNAPLHCMFLGSPGTGKTTVAKLLGKILNECGVLSSGHVVVRERSTLIGQYYSSEGENIRKALEEAQGGILFIDEAYQLNQPHDPKDPGRFVLESLMTA
ncbi:MAG: AAA family ATPase, partial [Duncaniella sp.]|nr:AAA family ATPase [Duncaniella sp.]